MHYEVSGEGDPLIVFHGACMNVHSIGESIPRLAEKLRVYAVELQVHGRTSDIEGKPYRTLSINTGHARLNANLGRYPGQEDEQLQAIPLEGLTTRQSSCLWAGALPGYECRMAGIARCARRR